LKNGRNQSFEKRNIQIYIIQKKLKTTNNNNNNNNNKTTSRDIFIYIFSNFVISALEERGAPLLKR